MSNWKRRSRQYPSRYRERNIFADRSVRSPSAARMHTSSPDVKAEELPLYTSLPVPPMRKNPHWYVMAPFGMRIHVHAMVPFWLKIKWTGLFLIS